MFVDKDGDVRVGRVVAAVVMAVAFVLLVIFSSAFVQTVPPGFVGVQTRFGKVLDEQLDPGFHFKSPLVDVTPYDTKLREHKEQLNVPTKEGMIAGLDVSVLYRIVPSRAGEMMSKLGGKIEAKNDSGAEVALYAYETTLVIPYTRNIGRDVGAGYGSEDLYNANREKIGAEIRARLTREMEGHGIVVENVLLRDVRLPAQVTAAIEQKIKMKQESEQMEFVLSKAKQEADRLRIEAQGIADSQKIISGSLTETYLQWKFISVMSEIEKGPNKTVVILPFDQKLMPMLPIGGQAGGGAEK